MLHVTDAVTVTFYRHFDSGVKATEDLSGICCRVGARRRFAKIYKRLGNRVRAS